jgi:hypothetical protein
MKKTITVLAVTLSLSLPWVAQAQAQPQEDAGLSESEEILPISRADRALSLYNAICLAALTDRVAFVDKALGRGLVPLQGAAAASLTAASTAADESASSSSPDGSGNAAHAQDAVFTPGLDSGIEVSIHADQRCSIWIHGEDGPQLRKGFQQAMARFKKLGYPIEWVLDRTLTAKDGPRQQLRAQALLGRPPVRFRFDALVIPTDKKSGTQALSVQLDWAD